MSDIIQSQYTDQVRIIFLSLFSPPSACLHPWGLTTTVLLCSSGTLWMIQSLVVFTWYWSGYQQYQNPADWTRSVNLFLFLSVDYMICHIIGRKHIISLERFGSLPRCCSCSLCSPSTTRLSPLLLCCLSTWTEPTHCLWVPLKRFSQTQNHHSSLPAVDWVYSCRLFFMCYYVCLQLKKSGKEPKAAAELVVGETTHRTRVRNRKLCFLWPRSHCLG